MNNVFVQSLGIGVIAYITIRALDWIIIFLLAGLESFSRWYRYYASPYSWQIALGFAVLWVIWSGVMSSRNN